MRPECTIIFNYILCYCMGSFVEAKVTSHWYPLVLPTSEETFHWAIIPAVSLATHTLLDPITPQHLPELSACVMAPLDALLRVKSLSGCS